MTSDLNKFTIEDHSGDHTNSDKTLDAPSTTSGGVTAHFRDIETHLLRYIADADAVLGCVAWLTGKAILAALARKNPVAIVVQKEDFLRPDIGNSRKWSTELRRRYEKLRCTWDRYDLPGIVSDLSVACDPSMNPVRCVGNYNRDKHPAFPRMHHKFIVFCRNTTQKVWDEYAHEWHDVQELQPYAVWTGSFNFTENAVRSLENGLYITDHAIVEAYIDEWARIEALSEPLDWYSDWVAPEWRIGT